MEDQHILALIKEINDLAHKKKTVGLNEEETAKQKRLYKEYLGYIRGQLKAQLDNIEIVDVDKDGKPLPKKESMN